MYISIQPVAVKYHSSVNSCCSETLDITCTVNKLIVVIAHN